MQYKEFFQLNIKKFFYGFYLLFFKIVLKDKNAAVDITKNAAPINNQATVVISYTPFSFYYIIFNVKYLHY